jgi:hypothetical protein
MRRVVHARLICSAEECTNVFEAWGPLEELEAFACECGCSLEIIGWPDPVEERDEDTEIELLLVA